MDGFFGVIKMLLGCGTILIVLLIAVAHLPNSPVRTLLIQICGWAGAALCGAAIVSPLDAIPDVFFPVGFVDDLIYLIVGFQSAKAAWNAGKVKASVSTDKTERLEVE
jgi:uncharacterized membrane protein YkvA (DUF1232 family)